jgi:folate-dependent tRNA-U54 methylase TrmFO/GidA
MKANFGILPELEGEAGELRGKRPRAKAFVERAETDLRTFLNKFKVSP